MMIQGMTTSLFGQDTPLSEAGMAGAAVLAFLSLAAVALLSRRMLRLFVARRNFMKAASEIGFDAGQASCLLLLAKFLPLERRANILTSRDLFEECVRSARIEAGDDLLAWPELLSESRINSLRRHFIATRRTSPSIADTHHLESNQPVTLHVADGSRLGGFVMKSDPSVLRISVAHKDLPVRIGMDQPIRITFARPQDARYEFRSRIIDEESHAVDVTHAPVNRIQQRSRVRVKCQNEVEWISASGNNSTRKSMLRDLSGGGACFITNEKLEPEAKIVVRLRRSSDAAPVDVPAIIVRQNLLEGTSQPMRQTSIRFDPLDPRHEYYISRMVTDLQQKLIRRMLARSGEEETDEQTAERPLQAILSIPVKARAEAPATIAETTRELASMRAE